MPNDNERLLSCPFCGPGMSQVDTAFDDVSQRWRVWCGRCGSSSGVHPRKQGSKEAAIKLWNTRGLSHARVPSAVAETDTRNRSESTPPAIFTDPQNSPPESGER